MAFNEQFMLRAIELAKQAESEDEVPVGAVLVKDGVIIAEGRNEKEIKKDATMHAEMLALSRGAQALDNWRMDECELYCTLEPCPMCAGAMINARLKTLYYGAHDLRFGCAGSKVDLLDGDVFNHKVTVFGGCLERKCSDILTDFFKSKRI